MEAAAQPVEELGHGSRRREFSLPVKPRRAVASPPRASRPQDTQALTSHRWIFQPWSGGARKIASLDARDGESRLLREPAHERTPERVFNRRWALALIERALGRLESEYARAGKAAVFAALKPALGGDRGIPYADLARNLGISEGAVKVAMHRLRARWRVDPRRGGPDRRFARGGR